MESRAVDVSIFEFDESTNQNDLHFQPISPIKLSKLKKAAKQAAAREPYSQFRVDDEWIPEFDRRGSNSPNDLPSCLESLLMDTLQWYKSNELGVWHYG